MSSVRPTNHGEPVKAPEVASEETEEQIFYRALLSRDRRFDGRFFTGVRTTGIYCRPICPARTPLEKNVRFFRTAAAAEEAGFRPCLRCRPESAPGTPAWSGTSATVTRALRLIRRGFEELGLSGLCSQLGIGERRLRQLFAEHVGASPQAMVRVQRLDFARRLIDETSLPFSAVAESSGFGSIRRFNAAVKLRFGKPPSALRKQRQKSAETAGPETPALVLHLPYRPPYAWQPLIEFLAARAIPGVESVSEAGYARTLSLGDAQGYLSVQPTPFSESLELRLHLSANVGLMEALDRVRTLFDLEADPLRIGSHLAQDSLLAPLVKKWPGLRVPGAWDGFELAVRAILGQQISVKGATTLSGRLVREFGTPISIGDATLRESLTHLFPEPSRLMGAEIERIGIPKPRAAALRMLAQKVVAGQLSLSGTSDLEATLSALCEIPGIGPWTAQYIAMRMLRDPDAFPATDLVLRRVVGNRDVERWRPWRAYAALYVWKSTVPSPSETNS